MHLTIEVTEEQLQYIENSAAFQGKTVENYLLERALLNSFEVLEEDEDIRELLELLNHRIESAKRGNIVNVSLGEIKEAVISRRQGKLRADMVRHQNMT